MHSVLRTVAAKPAGSAEDVAARAALVEMLKNPLTTEKISAVAFQFLHAGQEDDAEKLFFALMRFFPDDPAGHVGLARVRMHRHMWEIALESWSAARRLAGENINPDWILGQASSLASAGRPSQAIEIIEACSPEVQARPAIIRMHIRCLVTLHKLPTARAVYEQALQHCTELEVLKTCFESTALLFDGWARHQGYLVMLGKLAKFDQDLPANEKPPASALRLRLLLALRNYDGLMRLHDAITFAGTPETEDRDMRTVIAALRRSQFPDYTREKIFGIGLSRTGTTSLGVALRTLGYAALHWSNPLTGEIISDSDIPLFDAFVDTPSCMEFERNYYLLPNSKFIYTIRLPDEWERSWKAYTAQRWLLSDHKKIAEMMQRKDQFQFGQRFTDIHMSLYYNYPNYLEAYRAHDRRVRRFFADKPRNRFLEFDMFATDAWEKLCAFLDRDVPGIPFPWQNRGLGRKRGDDSIDNGRSGLPTHE
jgi:hypothetical protein